MAGYFESQADAMLEEYKIVKAEFDKEYQIFLIEDIKEKVHEIIEKYYDDYSPNSYRRKEDLYNAFKIIGSADGIITASLGGENMLYIHGSTSDNDAIYDNAFIRGYHGGSKSDKEEHNTHGLYLWKDPNSSPKFIRYLFDHPKYEDGEVPRYKPDRYKNMEDEIVALAKNYDASVPYAKAFMNTFGKSNLM